MLSGPTSFARRFFVFNIITIVAIWHVVSKQTGGGARFRFYKPKSAHTERGGWKGGGGLNNSTISEGKHRQHLQTHKRK